MVRTFFDLCAQSEVIRVKEITDFMLLTPVSDKTLSPAACEQLHAYQTNTFFKFGTNGPRVNAILKGPKRHLHVHMRNLSK